MEFFRKGLGRAGGSTLDDLLSKYPDKQNSLYVTADRLVKEGFLNKKRTRRDRRLKNFFYLTKSGLKESEINQKKRINREDWDGLWRILIFDIPEEEKTTRNYLRDQLKKYDFRMLQLSVWITPFPVSEEIMQIVDEIGAKYYVRFMVVNEINYEEDIRKVFGV